MEVPINSNQFLRSEYARLNRAYRCFAFLGLVTLPLGLAALLDASGVMKFGVGTIGVDTTGVGGMLSRWALALGMLLGGPILAGMLYATVDGIRQTVRFRHRTLVVLSVVSVVCWVGTIIYISYSDLPGHPWIQSAWEIGGEVYVAANVLIPGWWFIKGRRRYRTVEFAQE